MHSLLILNGPNLNMLGVRQTDVYGSESLDDIEKLCRDKAAEINVKLSFGQSNFEGELIEFIQNSRGVHNGIVLNAGAYTHTSIAIMDAIRSAEVPVVELHLSNIHARETYRHTSYIAPVAVGQICGFGSHGYLLAIEALLAHLKH